MTLASSLWRLIYSAKLFGRRVHHYSASGNEDASRIPPINQLASRPKRRDALPREGDHGFCFVMTLHRYTQAAAVLRSDTFDLAKFLDDSVLNQDAGLLLALLERIAEPMVVDKAKEQEEEQPADKQQAEEEEQTVVSDDETTTGNRDGSIVHQSVPPPPAVVSVEKRHDTTYAQALAESTTDDSIPAVRTASTKNISKNDNHEDVEAQKEHKLDEFRDEFLLSPAGLAMAANLNDVPR